ncbi:peptide/nickel transport system ATP-binding protein [Fictibacillus solisalsi]|uniref:Peptide/nickel transport system ATP-binding protein n=1 Tax=Fictibacillus solisalsi TaxID=459525 RepID=A0A1G9V396_9BACL|nr:ABC transporter ATP-binding protein [Fictibacillus solisalsi]SDM66527.1 peptide/nickel transport system ATP-binding protein [Fictibacillus solisalsi]
MSEAETPLLEVRNLQTHFFTELGVVPSVNGVSFSVKKGETIGIVGESGCGKSVTSLSLLQLISDPGKIVGGEILFNGEDLTRLSNKQMRKIRGNKISMIFQEPLTSLNPVFTIGSQISEAIRLHQNVNKEEAKEKAIVMLKKVGIPRAEKHYYSFPHLLSGGMRQRVMIAIALSCNPQLLIADEPTTALDVTIQAQILLLMKQLSTEYQTSIIIITHDLGLVAEMADRVVVMYAGQIVEQNNVYELFKNPKHPYTKGLLNSIPKIHQLKDQLESIEGNVPIPSQLPAGCKFHPRCAAALEKCRFQDPPLFQAKQGAEVRCWLHQEEVIGV